MDFPDPFKEERPRKKDSGERIEQAGKKMQKAGCLMTALFTIPILGLAIAGGVGLMIGLVVAAIVFVALMSAD